MREKKAREIRKLLRKPDAGVLLLINKVYGDKTKTMGYRQVYQALKKMYTMRLFRIKNGQMVN